MKIFKKKNMINQEEKEWLIWILVIIFSFAICQLSLIPKILQIHSAQVIIHQNKQKIKDIEAQLSALYKKDSSTEKTESSFKKLFRSKNSVYVLLQNQIQKNSNIKIQKLEVNDPLQTKNFKETPVLISFLSSKKDFFIFLKDLANFPLPIEILELETQNLSNSDIFATIHLLIKQKRGN